MNGSTLGESAVLVRSHHRSWICDRSWICGDGLSDAWGVAELVFAVPTITVLLVGISLCSRRPFPPPRERL